MGLIRPFKVTLQPQDANKTHDKLGNRYHTTSFYSLNVPLMGLMESIQDQLIDIPGNQLGATAAPPLKYKITKAHEPREKAVKGKNVPLF